MVYRWEGGNQVMEGEDLTLRDDLIVGDDLTVGWDVTITGSLSVAGSPAITGWVILGAGEDLVGSSTSDITINTNKFTVAGATGNTVVAGTLGVTGATTMGTLLNKDLIEDVTTTNILTAAESGSVYFLNSSTEFVSTLPAVATSAGVHYTFIVKAAPSGANYTIVTDSSENKIIWLQLSAAGDAGDTGTTDDTISFVSAQAVAGDKVEVYCDGAFRYAYAVSKVAAGITFTTAS